MKKCLWYAAAIWAAVTAAEAKRDFYVEKEVRCGAGGMCYEAASGMPLNGMLRRYYADGVVREDINYVNGVKNGVAQQYYPDGKQRVYMVYQNGVSEGGMSTYYNSGNTKFEKAYAAGMLNGAYKGYYEDGTLMLEGEYVNGKKNGRERQYYENGKLKSEIVFDMGEPVSANCRTADGQSLDFTDKAKEYLFAGQTPCGRY